jgi:hypothetical protein
MQDTRCAFSGALVPIRHWPSTNSELHIPHTPDSEDQAAHIRQGFAVDDDDDDDHEDDNYEKVYLRGWIFAPQFCGCSSQEQGSSSFNGSNIRSPPSCGLSTVFVRRRDRAE